MTVKSGHDLKQPVSLLPSSQPCGAGQSIDDNSNIIEARIKTNKGKRHTTCIFIPEEVGTINGVRHVRL